MQLRANMNMTQAQLAEKSGVPGRTIRRIENNEHPRCEWLTVMQILTEGFGVHLDITYKTPPENGVTDEGFIF